MISGHRNGQEIQKHEKIIPWSENYLLGFCKRKALPDVSQKWTKVQEPSGEIYGNLPRIISIRNVRWLDIVWIQTLKKTGFVMRKIQLKVTGQVYQVRPSFLMPWQIGKTEDISKGLYSYYSGMSFEAVSVVHGRNAMYWYRAFVNLGRYSLVGTTIKRSENIPEHLLADEKHSRYDGKKVYIATTVGNGAILGSSISPSASEDDLTWAYAEFMTEAQELEPNYQPVSVNTDGWMATQNAWRNISDKVVLVLCFLHAAMKIRDRSRRERLKDTLLSKVWDCYHAQSRASFSQQIRRLRQWTQENDFAESVKEKVFSLCQQSDSFKIAFELPETHRTSNMLDRLMNWQDRLLYRIQYLHRSKGQNANSFVRAVALIWNFHPFTKKTRKHSPFADLNHFIYHSNWLHNLIIAASLGGFHRVTNPIR